MWKRYVSSSQAGSLWSLHFFFCGQFWPPNPNLSYHHAWKTKTKRLSDCVFDARDAVSKLALSQRHRDLLPNKAGSTTQHSLSLQRSSQTLCSAAWALVTKKTVLMPHLCVCVCVCCKVNCRFLLCTCFFAALNRRAARWYQIYYETSLSSSHRSIPSLWPPWVCSWCHFLLSWPIKRALKNLCP